MTTPLPRAFLSHSSVDKPFVAEVFNDLGQTLAELDQATFEPAKFTREIILGAMERCSVFVLFASSNSLKSPWVATEIQEALKRTSDLRMRRVLVYCVDKASFKMLDPALKAYNIVRIEQSPLVCARQIRGVLADIGAASARTDLFIARDENISELKRLVIDPERDFRTLAISGFERLGRRTIAKRFCKDVYGSFTPPKASIVVDLTSSPADIFRQLLGLQFDALDRAELIAKITDFSKLSQREQVEFIGSEIRTIYEQREFVQFVDEGGVIVDNGDISDLFQSVLLQNSDISDLIHIIISYKTPQPRMQKKYRTIAFYRLPPLTDSQAEMSLAHEIKKRKAQLTKEQITKIVSVCDGHPANLDYVIGYIFDGSTINRSRLEDVLTGSKDFTSYKRERAGAYVSKFPFNDLEKLLIGALVTYRSLPSEMLAEIGKLRGASPAASGDALARLYELNIIDADGGLYRLIRPLRDALERDVRFDLKKRESDEIAKLIAGVIESYNDGDTVPIALIESASVAVIKSGKAASGWAGQLVLPSHFIWLAREAYHNRDYSGALEYSRKAEELSAGMTNEARLEALRFAGLACARLGLESDLQVVLRKVEKLKGKKATANKHFLLGFSARLRGDLNTALGEMEKAGTLLKGSIDIQRELISVHLAKRQFSEALLISEELVKRAEDNPYALDGYVQAKIATAANLDILLYEAEFSRRLSRLEDVGDGPGKSFYSLRMTDIALKKQDKTDAIKYAALAVKYTPNLPTAHAAYARALIANGQFDAALAAVQAIEEIGTRKNRIKDGLENLILYQVRFEYNLSRRRFDLCRADVDNMALLDGEQAKALKRDLAFRVAKSGAKIEVGLARWLKS